MGKSRKLLKDIFYQNESGSQERENRHQELNPREKQKNDFGEWPAQTGAEGNILLRKDSSIRSNYPMQLKMPRNNLDNWQKVWG